MLGASLGGAFMFGACGFGAFAGLRLAFGAGLGISFAFSACGFGAFAGLRLAFGTGLGVAFMLGAGLGFGPLLSFLVSLLTGGTLLLIALGAGLGVAVAFSSGGLGLLASMRFLFGSFLGVALLSGLAAGLLLRFLMSLFTGGALLSVSFGLGLRLGAMLVFLSLARLLLSLGLTIDLSLTLDLGDRLFFAFGQGLLLSLVFGSGGVRALTGLSFTFVLGVALSPFISGLLGADAGFPRFGFFLGSGLSGAFSAGPSLVQSGFLLGLGLCFVVIQVLDAGLGAGRLIALSRRLMVPRGIFGASRFSAATSFVDLGFLRLGLGLASRIAMGTRFVCSGFLLRLGLGLGRLRCRLAVDLAVALGRLGLDWAVAFGAGGFGADASLIDLSFALSILLGLGLCGAFVAGLGRGALLG